jgi:hypothetical protein
VVVAVVVGVLAAAGAAVAAGAGGFFGGSDDRQAILDNAAKRLGVTPQKLEDALKGATIDQIDAALAAGRITKEQADALKQRIQSGDGLGARVFGLPHGGAHKVPFGFLEPAANYLGLTEAQLREQLASGKTLAQIAKDQGKTVEGLEQAIVAGGKKQLDQAVADGDITPAQRDEMLSRLQSSVDKLVQGSLGGAPFFGGRLGGLHKAFFGFLDSVATYLGLTEAQLREQLASGKSLADVAKAQGKTVDGLKQAIVNGAEKQLAQLVADGRLTPAQRDEILSQLRANVDDLVQGTLPHAPGLRGFHGFREFRGSGFRSFDGFRGPRTFSPTLPATASPTF